MTEKKIPVKKKISTKKWRSFRYFLYVLPFMIFLFAFQYVPLFGWIYSFTDYKLGNHWSELGEFVGLKHFIKLFNTPSVGRIMRNTLVMSALGMVTSIFPLFMAVLLNEVKNQKAKKWIQTATTFPHFISWIIIAGLSTAMFSSTGVLNKALDVLGMTPFKYGLNANVDTAWTFMQGLNVWKGLGWSCIVYLAAIAGIDSELYDAGRVDGANRTKLIRYITIPCLMPTFLVLLLLKVGNILDTGFESYYQMMNNFVRPKLEVLDYYVYELGMAQGRYSFSIAVGMLKSLIGLILLFSTNWLSKRIRGNAMF